MKNVLILLALLAMTGIASAENLLSNGDFALGTDRDGEPAGNELDPTDWSYWNSSGGYNNRETNANGPYGDDTNFHVAAGYWGGYGAGFWQDVAGIAGKTYILTADAGLDSWWLNSGYLKIEFYGVAGTAEEDMLGFVESPHWTQPDYDEGLAWANYTLEGEAPAGTTVVRAILGTWGEGGTARFDNAVLEEKLPKATDPVPAHTDTVEFSLPELSWTNPDPNAPGDIVSVDVFILDAGTDPLVNDPNLGPDTIDPGVVQLADGNEINTIDLDNLPGGGTYTLTDDHYYYWAVHCTDSGTGVTTPGDIWYFDTGDIIPVANAGDDQYMWLGQDDSALDGGENDSNVLWFQVVATYTDDGKSPITDANFINENWGWDPDGADDIPGNDDDERGVELVSETWTHNGTGGTKVPPDIVEHTAGTVTAVYKTHYVDGDPANSTDIPGFWNIRLQVIDGRGTGTDASYHRIDVECATAVNADPSDDFDTYYDVNNDCINNLVDFAAFAEVWLNCNDSKLTTCL